MSACGAERMCPECRTTDASFPNIPGCQSCKQMLAHDEFVFWNSPLYWDEVYLFNGEIVQIPVTAQEFIRRMRQPWVVLYQMFTLS